MGKRRFFGLGLVIGTLLAGCSPQRTLTEAKGGEGGNGDEAAAGAEGDGTGGIAGSLGSATGGIGSGVGGTKASTSPDCADDQYHDGKECQPVTVCAEDEFEKSPPEADRDRVCEKAAECGENEYESSAPTDSTDRVCSALTVCGAGTWVSTPPTASTDRACSPCDAGRFSSSLNAAACARWSTCEAGESESVEPSATSDRVCSTCGAGKYEADGDCKSLTVCAEDQYESTPATATSDRKCSSVQSCQPGHQQTAAPTATTDRQCAPCGSGTFSTQVNATSCKPWTVCGSNQKQTAAGTPTSDTVCVDKPVCSTAPDRACTVDCPCASAEGVCTASNQCVSGTSCVPGSGKKVGRTGNTCLAGHCNNDKKDGGETSVDCGGECGCRVTFEEVVFNDLPSGTTNMTITTMSRDGKKLAGNFSKGGSTYPALFGLDGSVTPLETHGKTGSVYACTGDGGTVLGGINCRNPPTCTDTAEMVATWTGTAAPKVDFSRGAGRAISSTGTTFAGYYYDMGNVVFVKSGNNNGTILSDLSSVINGGMTPDGRYVAGALVNSGSQAGLVAVQSQTLTKIGMASWTSTWLFAINGTDPAIVGRGYIVNTDTFIGFRWKGAVLTELGVLAGGKFSQPAAVSADGSTVVGYTGTTSFQDAFIWTDQDKLRTLVNEMIARGYEPPVDFKLTNALFLSDDGKIIVGTEYTTPPSFWRVVLQ